MYECREEDTTVLRDGQATREAITENWRQMVEKAVKGDWSMDIHSYHYLRKASCLLPMGATVVLVLDCCYSGGVRIDNQRDLCADLAESRLAKVVSDINALVAGSSQDSAAKTLRQGAIGSLSVGSVAGTLRVGAVQQRSSSMADSGAWVDIMAGTQAFGPGIVDAAKRSSSSARDISQDKATREALQGLTDERLAAVLGEAIDLDPHGMCDIVDSIAGGLDASTARRQLMMRELSDCEWINTLLAAVPKGTSEAARSLVLSAAGGQERLRAALRGLPYAEKLALLEGQDSEIDRTTGRPWARVISDMLEQEPEATRTALCREIVRNGVPASRYSELLNEISLHSSIDVICMIIEAAGSTAMATSLCQHAKLQVQQGMSQPSYSRTAGGLLFPIYKPPGDGAETVSTSRAFDVVAHTASYAILDALRPEWAEGLKSSPEGGVLHEAFADLMTILAQLSSPAVCGSVVAQTRCDLRAANVAGRLQSSMADALGVCAMRSACSTLTALDVWDADGRPRETTRSSREVSAMITSAAYGAIATAFSSLLRGAPAGRAGAHGAAVDPAALLYALGKQALSVLVTACVDSKQDKAGGVPTLHQFCQRLLASSTVECPVSRMLWATLTAGASEALASTADELAVWKAFVAAGEAVQRRAAGKSFADKRTWGAIAFEEPEEDTGEGCEESMRKFELSLEYVVGCCRETPSLRLWRHVLEVSHAN
eukprot:m51a1_g11417 hypothetical protein (716) ;mRNA; r:4544-9569